MSAASENVDNATDRRGWLRTTIAAGVVGFAAATALWAAAIARFMVPNAVATPSSRFRAGRLADYPRGTVDGRFRQQFNVWLVHAECDGAWQLFALSARCTHLGCLTLWNSGENKFKCPCHGSGFQPDGLNVEGPAPRPLERFAIRLLGDGQIEVDRGRVFRQELGQWTDSASFIVAGEPVASATG